MSSPWPQPDVTVVVIVYNDAERLPAAVRSVLDQSLRSREVIVVDDHSTDGTQAVAERLAEENPDVVRYFRLPVNSGGCGAPRNAGIAQARGQYIMFLDSDDTIDRHACRNLVAMAEESGAELVIGRCVRRDVATGREASWMPWLVRDRAVYESLRDQPELLYDMLSTNKLYRHDFLIRENLAFIEDRLYEDNLFSAHAYLAAKKIAVIPQRIYTWNIQPRSTGGSITNRGVSVRNIADRIAVSKELDKLLAERGADDIQLQKDIRFIGHDLRTHLSGLSRLPVAQQQALIDVARPYLLDMRPEAFRKAKPLPAIAAFLARRNDRAGVAAVFDYMVNRGEQPELTTDLVVHGGHVYWCDRHLDDDLGRAVLDVTELGFQDLPLTKLRLGARLLEVRDDDGRITLRGRITNPIGRLDGLAGAKPELVFRARRSSRRQFTVPVTVESGATEATWTATFRPSDRIRPVGLVDVVYTMTMRVQAPGETFELRLFADDGVLDALRLPVRPRLTRLVADRLEGYRTDAGDIALRLGAEGSPARAGDAALRRLRSKRLGERIWETAKAVRRGIRDRMNRRSTKLFWYEKVFCRMPISRRTIVFESHMGKQYSDSPRAIYEELKRSGSPFRAVWAHAGKHANGFPRDVDLVQRQSYAYLRELGRAAYWVDNQGFPHDLRKRSGTRYIQTWHGSAFKRMGFDESGLKSSTRRRQEQFQNAIDRFDVFMVRSQHDERTLTRAMRVKGELMRVGYPRNDALVTGGDPATARKLRESLGLTDARTVVLYAPTFRASEVGAGAGLVLPFELDDFVERFGDDMVLLVRPHYLTSFVLPPKFGHSVRNVASIDDITGLLGIADALITDYSSLMFDYSLLDRPMIFHVPDLEDYVGRSRGAYFDLASAAPGPLTRTSADLIEALADLPGNAENFRESRHRFVARFSEYDKGQAAEAVVDRFFTPGARRG